MAIVTIKHIDAGKSNFTLLKSGHYFARIDQCVAKNISQGRGTLLEVRFRITQGTEAGRCLCDWILLGHIDANEVEKAERKLSRLAKAVGITVEDGCVFDSEDMHDIPLIIQVIKKKNKDAIERNYVQAYLPASEAESLVIA